MSNQYIRTDENKIVKYIFSDDFVKPEKDDILFIENASRHVNIAIKDDEGLYKYKYESGNLIERADKEKKDIEYYKQKRLNELLELKRKQIFDFEKNYDDIRAEYDALKLQIDNSKSISDVKDIEII